MRMGRREGRRDGRRESETDMCTRIRFVSGGTRRALRAKRTAVVSLPRLENRTAGILYSADTSRRSRGDDGRRTSLLFQSRHPLRLLRSRFPPARAPLLLHLFLALLPSARSLLATRVPRGRFPKRRLFLPFFQSSAPPAFALFYPTLSSAPPPLRAPRRRSRQAAAALEESSRRLHTCTLPSRGKGLARRPFSRHPRFLTEFALVSPH